MKTFGARKPFTVRVENLDGWWTAFCIELSVAGSGTSKEEALRQLTLSMRSMLTAQASSLKEDWRSVGDMVEFDQARATHS